MNAKKRVLVIGLEPTLVDFSSMPDMNAEKVQAGLQADQAKLNALGYDAHLCLTDLGGTAENVVAQKLSEGFDCVVIGAGLRTVPTYFLLFEKLINVVHRNAPEARLCFNTRPSDTADAVQRWL
ncbi:MAG: hypothetical protein EOP82_04040 [Variovorax sp.]|nr:MAG: hypothetical protein EOP82_04040 [Variovorax sp.]